MPRKPSGHYLHHLQFFYLPLAIKRQQFWLEELAEANQTNTLKYYRLFCERQVSYATNKVNRLKSTISYLSGA